MSKRIVGFPEHITSLPAAHQLCESMACLKFTASGGKLKG